jgi:hypothetical protein
MQHIKSIEKFLKNEIAATETYQQVLDNLKKEVELGESEALTPMLAAHKEAVANLEALNSRLEGEPTEGSGIWGAWAKMLVGTANLLGKESVLKALLEGEKTGAEDYKSALENTDLLADIRTLIVSTLLPAQHAHIAALEGLLEIQAA